MVSVESSVKAPAPPAVSKKPVSRKPPQNKDALLSSSSPSISLTTPAGDAKKSRNDPGHQASMSKLGKVPGLSISKSPGAQTGKSRDDKTQTLARSSQSSMAELASQLQTELRRSKENARQQVVKTQRRPPSHQQRPGVSSSKPSGGSNVVSAGSKSSDGNLLLASTLPPPSSIRPAAAAPAETPAKAASTTVPTDQDSPSVQRKRLLEMIAAEKADEERKRRSKRMKDDPRRPAQNKPKPLPADSTNNRSPNIPSSAPTQSNPSLQNTSKPRHSSQDKDRMKSVKKEPVDQSSAIPPPSTAQSNTEITANVTSAGHDPVVKKEKVDRLDFSQIMTNASRGQNPPPSSLPAPEAPSTVDSHGAVLTPFQVNLLQQQFEVKDYLSRREMRSLAVAAGMTDAQVRDWFKQKRIDEDVPTIVEERPAEYTLTNLDSSSCRVKEEPVEAPAPDAYGFEELNQMVDGNSQDGVGAAVKQEPVATEDDEAEPDSAVLDPLTGKLVKQRKIDKDMETIMNKAPLLESLAKKIEKVNQPSTSFKENFKAKVGNIIEILDDDIMITEENIVNPGTKEKPMSKVLDKFLSQVEELEKTIGDDKNESNFQLIRDNKRKDEELTEMSAEMEKQRSDISHLEKELRDKNDEIENILLNSVSKETFVRTQFQNLTNEVRQLREENMEKKSLQERVKELEKQLKVKSFENDEWKEKYNQTVVNMKELEETSTNMIGEITKGVGEKLALAKSREKELSLVEEKNLHLVGEVSKLEKQMIQLNDDHFKAREELSNKFKEQAATLVQRDEEVVKLKAQVGNLTKRFKDKVKEIQETLSKYNETLKTKNLEIGEKVSEINDLKEIEASQGKLIKMLKESVTKLSDEKVKMKTKEEELVKKLSDNQEELESMKVDLEKRFTERSESEIKSSKESIIESKALSNSKAKTSKRKSIKQMSDMEVVLPSKKLKIELHPEVFTTPRFLSPLDMLRLPLFEIPDASCANIIRQTTTVTERPSWPIVPYYSNPLLVDLLEKI